jgi:hypothetical protein
MKLNATCLSESHKYLDLSQAALSGMTEFNTVNCWFTLYSNALELPVHKAWTLGQTLSFMRERLGLEQWARVSPLTA